MMTSARNHQEGHPWSGHSARLTESDSSLAMTPSPPPNKPAHRRPGSRRGQRISSAQSNASEERPTSSRLSHDRPTSSALSRYNVLPPIDNDSRSSSRSTDYDGDHLVERTRKLSITKKPADELTGNSTAAASIRIPTGTSDEFSAEETVSHVQRKRKNISEHGRTQKTQRTLQLTAEPSEPPRLLLKVKLPDGSELKRHFRPAEPLQMILDFAEIQMKTDLTGYTLVQNAPTKEFADPNVSLEQAGIEDRTLLYLQTPAPE